MPYKKYKNSILQTKLRRPPLPVDLVRRPRLTKWLDRYKRRPLTLLSASAGYGKTTLISCWLESADWPIAWLSLDEHDNNIRTFLQYFVAAIQTIFPAALRGTWDSLLISPQPHFSSLSKNLLNELNQIESEFILVLDDYHYITSRPLNDLINEVLLHPPPNLHLVIGTRIDPLISLATLRAKDQVTEIRTQDLRLTHEEIYKLCQNITKISFDDADITKLDSQAEGWVTGVRLAALAIRHRVGQGYEKGELSFQSPNITEYLVKEILESQSSTMSECMIKISILERFNADLCEAICNEIDGLSGKVTAQPDFRGTKFLKWLEDSNLFVHPLDESHEWLQYHQLFRDILLHELAQLYNPGEVTKLHSIAGLWFSHNGFIEESLYHLIKANDMSAAINVVAQHRYSIMNDTEWVRLEEWLNLFSADVIETSIELYMTKIWLTYHKGKFLELRAMLQHIGTLLTLQPDLENSRYLDGEISSLKGLLAYFAGDADLVITNSQRALELLSPELWIVRVMARMYLGGGLIYKGDINGANQAIYGALEEEKVQNKRFKATLFNTACNIHWVTANMENMKHAAKQCIKCSNDEEYHQMLGYGFYQLGRVHYQHNELPSAEQLFNKVVTQPYHNYGICYSNSACGLGMTYQALGKEVEAREVIDTAIAFLLETGNTSQLPYLLAFRAELALIQGNPSIANQWAEKLDPIPPLIPDYGILAPHLILVKVWLKQSSTASQKKAEELLSRLQEHNARTHNTRFLIETLALRALLEQSLGHQPAALLTLEQALRLAQPGGFIRLFIDLGPQMESLLAHLRSDSNLQVYIEQLQRAFPRSFIHPPSISQGELLGLLTNRELQILEGLKMRLTNKEIAAQMVISPGTVKGHTNKIYQKLDVKNRRQAVEKAVKLGILSSE